MTQQELIQYIGNEEIANRLIKILGNPDLAKGAYDELEKSKNPSVPAETLHDTGVVDPPKWMLLYKGNTIDFKDGKVYVNKEEIPITFTEYIPFESIIRETLKYLEGNKLIEDLNGLIKENFDSTKILKTMIGIELDGKKVQICPKTGTVVIDGKDAGFKIDVKKPLTEAFAEIARKMGVKNEPKNGTISLHDALEEVKTKLKEAPVEVKASFNNIVKHLDEKKAEEKPKEDTPKEDAPKDEAPKGEEPKEDKKA